MLTKKEGDLRGLKSFSTSRLSKLDYVMKDPNIEKIILRSTGRGLRSPKRRLYGLISYPPQPSIATEPHNPLNPQLKKELRTP